MSYILDALRKSETERHQGKVPDLGRQLQMIHLPAKRRWPLQALLVVGLLLNAGVLAYIFWPTQVVFGLYGNESAPSADAILVEDTEVTQTSASQQSTVAELSSTAPAAVQTAQSTAAGDTLTAIVSPPPAPVIAAPVYLPPMVIVPSLYNNSGTTNRAAWDQIGPLASSGAEEPAGSAKGGRIPHLVELPLSFQRSVPDLTVNSHIFASVPQARRVMINNQNLRPGDSVQGLRVEQITEDGVVLSKQGQRFRLGIVRDWVSPR